MLTKVFTDQDAAEVIGPTNTGHIANELGTDLGIGQHQIDTADDRRAQSEQVSVPVLSDVTLHQIQRDRVNFIDAAHRDLNVAN